MNYVKKLNLHWFCTQNHILEPFSVRRACTKSYVTSEPYPRASQIWCQNVRETWKKKVIKCRGESFARCRVIARNVEGGGLLGPPPVFLGLICFSCQLTVYIIIYVIQLLKYIMLMSICSSVLFMFGNENKLKLETWNICQNVKQNVKGMLGKDEDFCHNLGRMSTKRECHLQCFNVNTACTLIS